MMLHRVLEMPARELGASAHRKVDIEVYMPGRGKWGEVTSLSNCTDYQSRRLNITHSPVGSDNPKDPGTQYVHTLNGTAGAVPRLILALFENGFHRSKSGVVEVILPSVLKPHWIGPAEGVAFSDSISETRKSS